MEIENHNFLFFWFKSFVQWKILTFALNGVTWLRHKNIIALKTNQSFYSRFVADNHLSNSDCKFGINKVYSLKYSTFKKIVPIQFLP